MLIPGGRGTAQKSSHAPHPVESCCCPPPRVLDSLHCWPTCKLITACTCLDFCSRWLKNSGFLTKSMSARKQGLCACVCRYIPLRTYACLYILYPHIYVYKHVHTCIRTCYVCIGVFVCKCFDAFRSVRRIQTHGTTLMCIPTWAHAFAHLE